MQKGEWMRYEGHVPTPGTVEGLDESVSRFLAEERCSVCNSPIGYNTEMVAEGQRHDPLDEDYELQVRHKACLTPEEQAFVLSLN